MNIITDNIKKVWGFIYKVFTHNYCDTCGFTKEDVFVTEYFTEAGMIECKTCIQKK